MSTSGLNDRIHAGCSHMRSRAHQLSQRASTTIASRPLTRTRRIADLLQTRVRRWVLPWAGHRGPGTFSDAYCHELPGPETAVALFEGQWSSVLPPPLHELSGGSATLFEDPRIQWGAEQFGGVAGLRVIEFGPLEAGHTYMLDRLGAADITAIEANRHAFLRCLVVKELLSIPSAHVLCGDFMAYLRQAVRSGAHWDLCLAVGVLYHQQDPVELLELATTVSDRLLLWTHYYDAEVIARRSDAAARFPSAREAERAGFIHTLYRHEYGPALGWGGFCGGPASWASWMARDDLFGALDHFGFDVVGVTDDDPNHPNGPALSIAARRRSRTRRQD